MDSQQIKSGMHVIVTQLETTDGMSIASKHLQCRKVGITGTVDNYVPGHGGDVWFVKHDLGHDIGAYCFTEFEALPQ